MNQILTNEREVSANLVASVWRSVLPSSREIRIARRRLHGKAALIGGLAVSAYWLLVVSDVALVLRMSAAVVLIVSLVAVGTGIMHDANHGSFSSYAWLNRSLAYTSDALGASSWLWRFQHNGLHHGNTNVVGVDADIALAPFARLAPSQPWHRWYRAQHVYIWPLYGFLTLKNFLVSDLVALIRGQMDGQPFRRQLRRADVVRIVLGKLTHIAWAILVPLLFNPWWAVLAFYLACSWCVGFMLAVVFQLAHCVDNAAVADPSCSRRGNDFTVHQLRTTVDVASPVPVLGHVFRWIVGGLDHQIEHHLAPRLPHTIYPKVAARFRRACSEHGIPYQLQPGVWAALRSHARWLRQMSKPDHAVS